MVAKQSPRLIKARLDSEDFKGVGLFKLEFASKILRGCIRVPSGLAVREH